MAKFKLSPEQDERLALHFSAMVEKLNKATAKLVLNKLKKMEYDSKDINRDAPEKHKANVKLYTLWREYIRDINRLDLNDYTSCVDSQSCATLNMAPDS
jgi:hypothetical protein